MSKRTLTFVLVPGGFHGAWAWDKVVRLLEADAHQVYAVTLTGLGDRKNELTPEVGLETHIQDVVNVLEENDLTNVILVGHSYGGMVITGTADRVPQRISHLVYLDSVVPQDGESMADIVPMVINRYREYARDHGDGWKVFETGRLPFGIGVYMELQRNQTLVGSNRC